MGFFANAAEGGLSIKNLGLVNSSFEMKPKSVSTRYVGRNYCEWREYCV